MTIARAQMNRQLYQMGGIGTLPMDYGQPLQVPQQQQPSFSSAQNITMNPLLNYGQPQLGQAGGTPLTMAGGGITRLGYQEGGMGMEMMQPQMQDPMMQEQMMQPQQMMEPPLQGMEGQQPDIKDPQQALDIIIQMLIAQGIPPEQAREIALQMVQAVAEGGVEEMSDERVEARFGGRIGYASGGIGSLVNREQYGFGSFVGSVFKGAGKLVSGAVNAVKKVASSPIGKAALTIAAIYATGGGAAFGGPGFGSAGTLFGPGGTLGGASGIFGSPVGGFGLEAMSTPGLLGVGGQFAPMSGTLFGSNSFLSGLTGGGGIGNLISKFGTNALISGAAGALGGALAGGIPQQEPGESDADYQNKVNQYKLLYQQGVSNPTLSTGINPSNLYPNNPFYPQRRANGGRIGYQEGGIGNLIKQTTQEEFFGIPMMANGGRINYGFGSIVGNISGVIAKALKKDDVSNTSLTSSKLDELINKGGTDSKSIAFQQVKPLYNYTLEDLYNLRKENNDYIYAANGGRIGYELGSEVPVRKNQAGVKELDYRDTGGFVPPIGIKERADDIPAMLSNNEFVFTADAVRNAGGGDENLGAKRMYTLMKKLESGGSV
jgi:hypothetical protein